MTAQTAEKLPQTAAEKLPAEPPTVDVATLGRLAENSQGPGLFGVITHHALKQVCESGYFNKAGRQLERFDRIMLTASADTEKPEHATLLVVEGRTARERGAPVVVEVL